MKMTMQTHGVKFKIWAFYYEGRFSHFEIKDSNLNFVKEDEQTFQYDKKSNVSSELVKLLDAEIQEMRAMAEVAIDKKLEERNKLLSLEMAPQSSDIFDDIPF
jgi:hypothetical protein